MKLKRYKKKTLGSYITLEIVIIILGIIMAILVVDYFYHRFNKVILPLAENETKRYITEIINNATKEMEFDNDLLSFKKNSDNEIKMVVYDAYKSSKMVNKIISNIQDNFDIILGENNYIISNIPLGVIFNNGLLRELGPVIKVRLKIIGNIIGELQTQVKPYGINNALVELRLKLKIHAQVILPVVSSDIDIINEIPIFINIVNGSVPEAYISTYK